MYDQCSARVVPFFYSLFDELNELEVSYVTLQGEAHTYGIPSMYNEFIEVDTKVDGLL